MKMVSTFQTSDDVRINRNMIDNSDFDGILVNNGVNAQIRDNTVTDSGADAIDVNSNARRSHYWQHHQ